MSHNPKEAAFKRELFDLMKRYGAVIKWDPVYYPGETEGVRFDLPETPCWLDMHDLQEEFDKLCAAHPRKLKR